MGRSNTSIRLSESPPRATGAERIKPDDLLTHFAPGAGRDLVVFALRIEHHNRARVGEERWDNYTAAFACAGWGHRHQVRRPVVMQGCQVAGRRCC